MKYETEKDWCLRLYAFVGLGYLATYYVLAKFAAPLRWRDLCFFPAGCYEVVFSWQAVAAAVVSAVQAMFLACSRLRAAKLMWLCAAGWLGAAAFGVLPLLLPHVWEPRGGFPDGLILCSLWLLQSFVYFVLKWRNKGDFSLGLLLLALEPIVSFASCLTVGLRSPALLVLFTGLVHHLMLGFAYLPFLRHPVALDGRSDVSEAETSGASSSSLRCLYAAAVIGIVYAAVCIVNGPVLQLLYRLIPIQVYLGINVGIVSFLAVAFCMSFLLLFLAGARGAAWGLAGSGLMLMHELVILYKTFKFWPQYHLCQFALSVVAFVLVVVSFAQLRGLFPRWGRWFISIWVVYGLCTKALWGLRTLVFEPDVYGSSRSGQLLQMLFSSFHQISYALLAASYVGMIYLLIKQTKEEDRPSADPASPALPA